MLKNLNKCVSCQIFLSLRGTQAYLKPWADIHNNVAGHIVTGDLKIITDSRIWSNIGKGPKYRFPLSIDFKSCRKEIADAYMNFVIAGVDSYALIAGN